MSSLTDLILKATAKWAKQRKAEIRSRNAALRRTEALARRYRPSTLKEAAFQVMRQAYLKASANGTLPANARQIYYAARGPILEITGRDSLDSNYFTQSLLIAYLEERNPGWEPVWDDRGHFAEPHTDREIGLGTLSVRAYLKSNAKPQVQDASLAAARIDTHGPEGRYGGVVFVEKEGFMPLFGAAKIGKRFDVAVTSSKGMSVTAARELVDDLCGRRGLPLYIMRDFDISGFSIAKTLTTSNPRYRFRYKIKTVVDLGLRLIDVEELGLESESVAQDKNPNSVRERLLINGATEAEADFLLDGDRVELNAMASDQLVAFVERKLTEAGAQKLIPNAPLHREAYAAFKREKIARAVVERYLARLERRSVAVPADLEARVRVHLAKHPADAWDEAVRRIADDSVQAERPANDE
jgi:hypothetical protein